MRRIPILIKINIIEDKLSNNNNAVTDYVNDSEIINIKRKTNGNNFALIDEKMTSPQCEPFALKT